MIHALIRLTTNLDEVGGKVCLVWGLCVSTIFLQIKLNKVKVEKYRYLPNKVKVGKSGYFSDQGRGSNSIADFFFGRSS